jgi:NAD(P)-dependent dehydrogenase (short-subunit alcohol dehydrogenase family)
MQLKGKTAFISGGGRNAGRAIATTFAREGADLILIARERLESLQEVARECENYGVKVLPMLGDMSKPDDVNRAVNAGLEKFGKIDQLVCVAAHRAHKPFLEFTYEEWLYTFSINAHSAYLLARAVIPNMLERKSGNIIALGSVLSITSKLNQVLETSCKHALFGLIKGLAVEYTPQGIRSNLILIGSMENKRANPELYPWEASGDPLASPDGRRVLPMGRKGKSQEIANVALFLASDQSSYISGDRISCSGGAFISP